MSWTPSLRKESELYALSLKEKELRLNRRLQSNPRGGLIEFVRYFWHILEPNRALKEGEPLEALCMHLEAVADGRIKRLLINVPPGFMKSLLSDVFFLAWLWGPQNRPGTRIVAFSYAAHLTERDNGRFRDLVNSYEYREMWGHNYAVTGDGKVKISNDKTGWKFASSVGGVGTGERGDILILDDPHNVKEAESETVRTETVRWFQESMSNRLNDPNESAIIVIMQRVHEADVSGCIVEQYPEYIHLCIPMEYEDGRHCVTPIGWEDWRSEDGELAWPSFYDEEALAPFKRLPFMWAGQYQQRPEPRGGGIIKRDYWRIWNEEAMRAQDVQLGKYPPFEFILASFDGAFTEKEENDFCALTVWGVWVERNQMQLLSGQGGTPRLMLIDAWHKRLTLHGKNSPLTIPLQADADLRARYKEAMEADWGAVEHVAATCRKFKVNRLIIENKSSGFSVEQELRRLYSEEAWTVQLVDPGRMDKVQRVYAVQHLFADGVIWRPDTEWAQMVEDEFATFPRGSHDDLVDTGTQAITLLRRMQMAMRGEEAERSEVENTFFARPAGAKVFYES